MNNQQTPERSVMDEVIETLIKKTELLEKELAKSNASLLAKEERTQGLLAEFEKKFAGITVQSPQPNLTPVEHSLRNGLKAIGLHLEKWPKQIRKEYRISLFPEQTKSVEYVRAVLTRLIVGASIILFLILAYLLMDKHFK